MEYTVNKNDIEIICPDFNLDETLDCGQAFRWEKIDSEYDITYKGFFVDRFLRISQNGEKIIFHDTTSEDFENVWTDYFDLNTDYSKIKLQLSEDETLKKACDFAGGIRLLKQDLWETLVSFIISQNNNIPRIKGIISRLCEHYGHFPTAVELSAETPESLDFLRAGFRAKYIVDASMKISSGEIDADQLKQMPIADAKKTLMTIKGVGNKVSECVLLFGMYRTEAFPVDVWIKRVMESYYPNGLPDCTKGIEGIAQQYLFHYIRNLEKN
ncbi:MAG: DNA-3-methyladenine glycosylase 2 family protein [Oscillospiraceae bacterium]|nr:DNA-3-methyladenine glycosylase 2 family protein [Oscillospiraceae bacterium]